MHVHFMFSLFFKYEDLMQTWFIWHYLSTETKMPLLLISSNTCWCVLHRLVADFTHTKEYWHSSRGWTQNTKAWMCPFHTALTLLTGEESTHCSFAHTHTSPTHLPYKHTHTALQACTQYTHIGGAQQGQAVWVCLSSNSNRLIIV